MLANLIANSLHGLSSSLAFRMSYSSSVKKLASSLLEAFRISTLSASSKKSPSSSSDKSSAGKLSVFLVVVPIEDGQNLAHWMLFDIITNLLI